MDNQAILDQLLKVLEQNQVTIRTETMGGNGGGLCRLQNKTVFFYDKDAAAAETTVLAAKAVRNAISDLEGIYLKPAVREFIDNCTELE